jgi:hypothetical protein
MTQKKLILSPEYPQGILVDLTAEDIAQREQDAIQSEQNRIAKETKEAEDLANKQSALNKLKALGLNDAEINSILGK